MNQLLRTKPLVILFIMTLFLLAACSGAEQIPVSEAPTLEAESQPTEAESQPTEAVPTEIEPTKAAVSESGGGVSASGLQMECTLVSDQPDTPAEYVAIFNVTEDDWVIGPDTAAVTFVEYSDFQ